MLRIRRIACRLRGRSRLGLNLDVPTVTLRGAFGYALLDFLASSECYLSNPQRLQTYRVLFDPEGAKKTGNTGRANAPRPFVMRGGFEDASGKNFLLELLLFGRAVEFEPLVLDVLAHMGRRGVGRWKTPANVEILDMADVEPYFPSGVFRVEVEFISPARIKAFKRRWLDDVPFAALVSRLADRYADLVRLYGRPTGRDWDAWLNAQKTHAQDIASTLLAGGRVNARRISSRSRLECRLDGFVGRMLYEGNFDPFSEILAHLPFIHVGNSAAFGCGWCVMTWE